jgi:hypothetical protein
MGQLNTRTRYMLVGSDFSAQEPRLTAFMSQSPQMMQAYFEGKDLYAVIAQSMFNNEYWENLEFYPEGTEIELDGKKIICGKKTHLHKAGKERRSAAKTMLLAILYGMSAKTAGARMGKSAEEGQELMDNFFGQFPDVKKLIDASKAMLSEKGYVEDWAGRRRHLPDFSLPAYEVKVIKKPSAADFNPFLDCEDRPTVSPERVAYWEGRVRENVRASQRFQRDKDPNYKENDEMSNTAHEKLAKEALAEGILISANTGRRAQAERQCLNARIQGGAASLTKLAMVNVDNDPELRELDAHLVITVHDEVLVECPMAYAEKVEKRLPQVMIDTAKPFINVPMACDPYAERQWYIGEYSVSIQAEFKKLEAKGLDKETALAKVIENHPDMFPDAIRATIETGEEIDSDAFAHIVEDIEEIIINDDTVEETEDEDTAYINLFE